MKKSLTNLYYDNHLSPEVAFEQMCKTIDENNPNYFKKNHVSPITLETDTIKNYVLINFLSNGKIYTRGLPEKYNQLPKKIKEEYTNAFKDIFGERTKQASSIK